MIHFLPLLVFSLCTYDNSKSFNGRMFSSYASSACTLNYTAVSDDTACGHVVPASDSFQGTGDSSSTIRGKSHISESRFKIILFSKR